MPAVRLARITVYPFKSLDGKTVESVPLSPLGGIVGDRIYALVDAAGDFVNGKAERRIHRVRSGFDLDSHALSVRCVDAGTDTAATFTLPQEASLAEDWFRDYLGYDVTIEQDEYRGFPDDTTRPGPTLVSTATIETVASWFDLPPDQMRRRLRANLEVEGVPAFWEDRLFADHGEVVRFTVGEAVLDGINPCQRCVVPSRDPDTGEETPGFRERFVNRRRETRPAWTDSDRFDHDYRVMVNTRIPGEADEVTAGDAAEVTVGDAVEIVGTRPE